MRKHGLETFRKIVRHELCHYHLYFQGKGYKHADRDFKDLLAKVDGLRYRPQRYKVRRRTTTFINANLVVIPTVDKRRVNTNGKVWLVGLCRRTSSYFY